jgi:hypothetical protein
MPRPRLKPQMSLIAPNVTVPSQRGQRLVPDRAEGADGAGLLRRPVLNFTGPVLPALLS